MTTPKRKQRKPERARASIKRACYKRFGGCGHPRKHHFRDRGKERSKAGPKYCHVIKADGKVCGCTTIATSKSGGCAHGKA